MRRKGARFIGPYQEGARWRVIEIDSTGRRNATYYDSEREARQAVRSGAKELKKARPIAPLIAPYLAELREQGQRPRTLEMLGSFLRALHEDDVTADWTPQRAATTVDLWKADWSVATRRLRLLQCRFFWRWLVAKGKAQSNPFEGLAVTGKLNAGKPQLRITEAHRFTALALNRFEAGYVFALAPLMALMMGMRASEITDRIVRDVDDEGAVIWIDAGKTKNSRRHLKVPKCLRPLLAKIVEGRDSMEPLWGRTPKGHLYIRQDLHSLVWELCDQAKVPRVCTHSLRGLWATLAVESGAAAESVAAALGHSSFEVTAKHYAQPAAVHSANTDRAVSILFRDRSVAASPTESPTGE